MIPAVAVERDTERQWPEPAPSGLRSVVYLGTVRHRRFGPGPERAFSYRAAMPLLDLAEVGKVCALHPLLSDRWPAPVRFRRDDFLGDPGAPLDAAVHDVVASATGMQSRGPVALLGNVRTWGWLFNPISLYFCADGDGRGVGALVAEVQNTPWHERTAYVVGPPGEHRFAKELHVSPFLPMDLDYRLRYSAPGLRLRVVIDVLRGPQRLFSAQLDLRRQEIDRHALGRLVWHQPAATHRVSAGIYAQAARLHLSGGPFFRHPPSADVGNGAWGR